jgi:hypothetical protein
MAGTQMERNAVVANVARRLFGTPIADRNVITETLRRTTPENQTLETVRNMLGPAIRAGVPMDLDFAAMAAHPMSVWVELTLGLTYEDDKPRGARPRTLADASKLLHEASGESVESCLAYLQQFLLCAYAVTDDAGKSLFAFRLHQFIAGGGKVYTTLEMPGRRAITLDGQQFVSGDDRQSPRSGTAAGPPSRARGCRRPRQLPGQRRPARGCDGRLRPVAGVSQLGQPKCLSS